PVIAKLVQQTPGLELRLVNSTIGRPWMEAHRSPDGRASTPTVLVLDDQFTVRGCWVEQPAALQEIWLPIVARGAASAELDRKMDWYAADGGREILREIIEVLEGARDGRPICPGAAPT
ncbi:MAG TPA: thioredoxin family protein, partial [Longimicrobiales bacterium]|nr:thioredoxin family protein [Longimicrobiales bacterium]